MKTTTLHNDVPIRDVKIVITEQIKQQRRRYLKTVFERWNFFENEEICEQEDEKEDRHSIRLDPSSLLKHARGVSRRVPMFGGQGGGGWPLPGSNPPSSNHINGWVELKRV